MTRPAPTGDSRHTSGMGDAPAQVRQHMRDRLAAHAREVAAVEAVTETLLNRGWEALRRGQLLLAWFDRYSG